MQLHNIEGANGLNLHVREWGKKDGPAILFIHGWSQSHMCWVKQVESSLAREFQLVALDLRGHGMSDKPKEVEQYDNSQVWADDIQAVIAGLSLNKPVLVGWSYGGLVMLDYVRCHGQDNIAGLMSTGGACKLNETVIGTLIGPGFYENAEGCMIDDLPTNIETIRKFLRDCLVREISQDDFEVALAFNMATPNYVRANLTAREIDNDDVLSAMTVPVLVNQGEGDIVVLPDMGNNWLDKCSTAKPAFYAGVGHIPFMEAAERFNKDLAEFVRATSA